MRGLDGSDEETLDMETLGLGLFFEDLPIGRSFKTIGRTITETDIINFVTCTGMTEVLFSEAKITVRRV